MREPFPPTAGGDSQDTRFGGAGLALGFPMFLTLWFALHRSLEQLISPLAFPASSSPDPCAKETVLNAIRESRKRAVVEEEDEDQAFGNDQENKRR